MKLMEFHNQIDVLLKDAGQNPKSFLYIYLVLDEEKGITIFECDLYGYKQDCKFEIYSTKSMVIMLNYIFTKNPAFSITFKTDNYESLPGFEFCGESKDEILKLFKIYHNPFEEVLKNLQMDKLTKNQIIVYNSFDRIYKYLEKSSTNHGNLALLSSIKEIEPISITYIK